MSHASGFVYMCHILITEGDNSLLNQVNSISDNEIRCGSIDLGSNLKSAGEILKASIKYATGSVM